MFYPSQVKPKKAIVKDVSKKTNKDLGDPAGIFMGEREYILYLAAWEYTMYTGIDFFLGAKIYNYICLPKPKLITKLDENFFHMKTISLILLEIQG